MSKITMKTNKTDMFAAYEDAIRELELTKRQLADTTTEKGVLMNQLATQEPEIPQAFKESYATLVDERNQLIIENQRLTESCVAAHERCDALEAIVATKSAPQPQRQAAVSKPLPSPAVAESAPVISITDSDKAVWSKFQALSREQRMVIINWARPQFGHVGVHNIIEVRAAWHEFNNPSSCADESVLADIA
jgi:hypothetical protein